MDPAAESGLKGRSLEVNCPGLCLWADLCLDGAKGLGNIVGASRGVGRKLGGWGFRLWMVHIHWKKLFNILKLRVKNALLLRGKVSL